MNNGRMRKIMLNYRQNVRIRLGRTLKRPLDQVETGLSRPTRDGWWCVTWSSAYLVSKENKFKHSCSFTSCANDHHTASGAEELTSGTTKHRLRTVISSYQKQCIGRPLRIGSEQEAQWSRWRCRR